MNKEFKLMLLLPKRHGQHKMNSPHKACINLSKPNMYPFKHHSKNIKHATSCDSTTANLQEKDHFH